MSKKECAVKCFKEGFNCCQAVFGSFCEDYDLDREMGYKLACGFGSGMRAGEVCGAVTGALMALGLKHGMSVSEDQSAKQNTYALVSEFQRQFKDIHGSILCKDLLGYDITKPEDMKVIQENNLFNSLCPNFIEDAIKITEKII